MTKLAQRRPDATTKGLRKGATLKRTLEGSEYKAESSPSPVATKDGSLTTKKLVGVAALAVVI